MTRVTYHCPNCGDPDREDANHSISMDGSFYWCVETQSWESSDGPSCDDLYCSECGDIGSEASNEVELPDLSPAEVLAIARRRARDLEHETAAAWRAVREAEAEVEARQAAFEAEAARAKRLRDAAPELLSLLYEATEYAEATETLEGAENPSFATRAKDLFRAIEKVNP